MRYFVKVSLSVLPLIFMGGIANADTDKIGNAAQDLKSSLKSASLSSSTADLGDLMDGTKIASLQTDDLKMQAQEVSPFSLEGAFVQGGLVMGQALPGSQIRLDDIDVDVDSLGRFILGFHRDHPETAILRITLPSGDVAREELKVTARSFKEDRVDGLPSNKVNEFSDEDLAKIKVSTQKKNDARANMSKSVFYDSGFDWPITGRISGVFGSRRILNGVPRRPHSGVDVAAPTGSELKAPADGIITLADPDMFFEGGLVLIDHGQGLESAIMHMSRLDVVAGQKISKGDVIGAVGATGRATGPHMHWSLKWKSRLLDAQLLVPEM